MALTGVTGARASLHGELPDFLARVRALTDVPLVVGFGVSKPEHLAALATDWPMGRWWPAPWST